MPPMLGFVGIVMLWYVLSIIKYPKQSLCNFTRTSNLYLHHISQTAMDGRNIPGFYYGK